MITVDYMLYIGNTVGLIGDVLLLVAYFLLQSGRVDSQHLTFSLMNLLGALMILFSLFFSWNLPAAVIEVAWSLISILGIVRVYLGRHR